MPRCIIKTGLLVLLLALGTFTVCEAEVNQTWDVSYLPETNPYRDLLLDVQSLSEADATALLAWGNGDRHEAEALPTTLKTSVDRLTAKMRATQSKTTQLGDWPLRGDEKRTVSQKGIPFQPVRILARVMVRASDEMPAKEAVDVWLALIQFGRNFADERTLVSSMMAVVLENAAFEPMRRRCGELSPDDLLRLARGKAALRPSQALPDIFENERELLFIPAVDQEYLPALRLLVDEKNKQSVSAFERVEVRGIIGLVGGRGQISLRERGTGRAFAVGSGEMVAGFELVSFDLEERTAIIRHAGREAKVDLSNNKITVDRPELHSLKMLFWSLETGPGTDEDLQRLAEQVVQQGGPESHIAYAKHEYARVVRAVLALAARPTETEPETLPRSDSMIADTVAKAFYKIARLHTGCRVRDRMLDRAIQIWQEKAGDPTTAPVTDPWAEPGTLFKEEAMEDGGIRITSRFEKAVGSAISCEFPAGTNRGHP